MRWFVLLLLFESATALQAADRPALKPGAEIRLEFPGLPQPLEGQASAKKCVSTLTARLPDNYTPSRPFPLFVFLNGSTGGCGTNLEPGRSIIGLKDYICVNLPLYRGKIDRGEYAGGLMISLDDYAVISKCYREMLSRLFELIPNISEHDNVLGGHSNGGHSVGVLLAEQDAFTFDHFNTFILHEGGVGHLLANVMQKTSMRRGRFLVVVGEKGDDGESAGKSPTLSMMRALQGVNDVLKLNFTFVVMKGYGHELPPEYQRLIGEWTRGESPPAVEFRTKIDTLLARP